MKNDFISTKNLYSPNKKTLQVNFPSVSYIRKDNETRSSSNTFSIHHEDCTAWSYGWWCMMKLSKDKKTLVRNKAGYSMQTGVHQGMLDRVLELEDPELHGIKVLTVYTRKGLQNLQGEIEELIYNEAKYKQDNSKAIKEIQKIQKILGEKVYKPSQVEIDQLKSQGLESRINEQQRAKRKRQERKQRELEAMKLRAAATIERMGPQFLEDCKQLVADINEVKGGVK